MFCLWSDFWSLSILFFLSLWELLTLPRFSVYFDWDSLWSEGLYSLFLLVGFVSKNTTCSSPCRYSSKYYASSSFAPLVFIVWIHQLFVSVPQWSFIPKYHWFPFLVCFISGSLFFSSFFVELDAEMMVASTLVHFWSIIPCEARSILIRVNISFPPWLSSSACLKFSRVVASGTPSDPASILRNFWKLFRSQISSSTLTSARVYHVWRKNILSMRRAEVFLRQSLLLYHTVSTRRSISDQGIILSISSRNCSLRVTFPPIVSKRKLQWNDRGWKARK